MFCSHRTFMCDRNSPKQCLHVQGQGTTIFLGQFTTICEFVHSMYLGIEGGIECPGSLHGGHHMSTLALVGRDDANLFRLDATTHEVGHNLLDIGRLCIRCRSISLMSSAAVQTCVVIIQLWSTDLTQEHDCTKCVHGLVMKHLRKKGYLRTQYQPVSSAKSLTFAPVRLRNEVPEGDISSFPSWQ